MLNHKEQLDIGVLEPLVINKLPSCMPIVLVLYTKFIIIL